MADSAWVPNLAASIPASTASPRHSLLVRITHWITALSFLALLVTGLEIVVSHPRFYWGETGNSLTPPLFQLPVPASRESVPTGYRYVLPDQNGWSRYLHFQSAWLLVLTGLLYTAWGVFSGHFRRNLLPPPGARSWTALASAFGSHLRFQRPGASEAWSYNLVQRYTYLGVIFALFPLMIWTGLALSPGFVSAFPATVTLLGGQQSARTMHFFLTLLLVAFAVVHIVMVCRAGFKNRTGAMITGHVLDSEEQP